jgi:hypothetical protein
MAEELLTMTNIGEKKPVLCLGESHGDTFAMYNGDAVEVLRQFPDRSVDFSVYSPPFSSLYTYSDSDRDMGNCADDGEFFRQYGFMLAELFRIMRPGRLVSVHCKDLVDYRGRDGQTSLPLDNPEPPEEEPQVGNPEDQPLSLLSLRDSYEK